MEIITIYEKIHGEYKSRYLNYHELIRIYLNEMFIKLARFYSTKNSLKLMYNYELIQLNRFESLIDEHYKEHKPLSFYAEELHISLKPVSYTHLTLPTKA